MLVKTSWVLFVFGFVLKFDMARSPFTYSNLSILRPFITCLSRLLFYTHNFRKKLMAKMWLDIKLFMLTSG